jgi:hypothetical protein
LDDVLRFSRLLDKSSSDPSRLQSGFSTQLSRAMLTPSTCTAQPYGIVPGATNKSVGQPCGARGQILAETDTGLRSLMLRKTGIPASDLLGNVALRNRAQHLRYLCSNRVYRVAYWVRAVRRTSKSVHWEFDGLPSPSYH